LKEAHPREVELVMLRSGKTTLLNKQDLNIDHQKKEFISQIGLELSPSNL